MRLRWSVACLMGLLCCVSMAAISPVTILENASQSVIQDLTANHADLKKEPKVVYDIVQTHLVPLMDVTGMSRSALGREVWKKASAEQRNTFSRLFTQLVVRTYSGALSDFNKETIRFKPIANDFSRRKRIKIDSTIIRQSGPDIPLTYRLIQRQGTWKVYDMSVDGVSLLHSFRAQFKHELQKGDLQGLIDKLSNIQSKA